MVRPSANTMQERTSHAIKTTDGVTVSVDVYGHGAREAAVIICPGFFQSKDTATFQRMSRALAQDYDVLAMDFRGHGRSSGRFTFSAQERADLDAVLAFTQQRYPRIGIIGFSLGAATSIHVVSGNPAQVKTLIAVSPPSSFDDIEFKFWTPEAMRTGLKGMEAGAGCRPGNPLLKKARPIDTIRHIRDVPIYIIHGTKDVIIDVAHSRRLYPVAPEPKRLDIIEGGSHAEALFRDDPQGFLARVTTWLQQTLPPAAS